MRDVLDRAKKLPCSTMSCFAFETAEQIKQLRTMQRVAYASVIMDLKSKGIAVGCTGFKA